MTSWITICDTCKRDDWADRGMELTDGGRFADLVEVAAATEENIRTRRVSCMMGCDHGCNVAIQGAGKLAYTLGRFEGTAEDAEAIVDYTKMHAESDTGRVPFREWPAGVKGHFVTRHPPLPSDE